MSSESLSKSLNLPKLESAIKYVQWRADVIKILGIYGLLHCIDPTKRRYTIPIYPPCGLDIRELEFRQKQNSIDKAMKKESDEQWITVFIKLQEAIPKQNVRNWTKNITESNDLWVKIEEMNNWRADHHKLKLLYKAIYKKLRCLSGSLADIMNYEAALEGVLGDYENVGGFITMDDIIEKIKADFKPFKSIYDEDLIKFTISEGNDMVNYPSTNGWTYTQMLERIKDVVEAFDGPDYLKQSSERDVKSNRNQKKVRFDSRRDYNNENRKKLRDNIQRGD
jgi:hypothetical protein